MKRNHLCRRKKSSNVHQSLDLLERPIKEFKDKFSKEVLSQQTYDLENVINVDETYVTRDSPSETTIETVGVKSVPIRSTGAEKTRYTVILANTLTGEKLPAMIVWRTQGKRNVHAVLPDNV